MSSPGLWMFLAMESPISSGIGRPARAGAGHRLFSADKQESTHGADR